MSEFIKQGKQLAQEYIARNFANVPLTKIASPCPKLDEDNKDPVLYFTDGKAVYLLSLAPHGFHENVYRLQKVILDKPFVGDGIENYKFQKYETISDNGKMVEGRTLDGVLEPSEYKSLAARIK
jgi:hypothetical protein